MSALAAFAAAMEKAIGKNADVQEVSHWLDTGYPLLNEIIMGDRVGGWPYGRMVEIYGPSSSGKTLLATLAMIAAQKAGGAAIFIDFERSFDVDMASRMGLDTTFPAWIYKTPKTWEEGNTMMMEAASNLRKLGLPKDIPIVSVLDSIASAVPKSVVDKGISELTMNDTTALARVTSTTLKSVKAFVYDFNMTAIYLNQIRTKPGVVYGDPTTTPGGQAMGFYADCRLAISRSMVKDAEKEVIGQDIKIKAIKTKFRPPFAECEIRMMFDEFGTPYLDVVGSLVDHLIDKKMMPKDGNYFVWDGKKLYRNALVEQIVQNGQMQQLIDLLPAPKRAA